MAYQPGSPDEGRARKRPMPIKSKKKVNLTYEEFYAACERADKLMKEEKGHQMFTILKTRCQLCGRSPRQKGKCRHWIKSLLDNLFEELTK